MSDSIRCAILVGALLVAISNISVAQVLQGEVDYKTLIPIITLNQGKVSHVGVEVGDRVSSDEVLIEFDSTTEKAKVRIRQSVVDQLKIEVSSISDKFDRQQEMFDRGSLSLLAYDETENALKTANARLNAAQAELTIAENELERTKLVAPIDAVVVERNIHPGMNVIPELQTRPLMLLTGFGSFIVRLNLEFESWNSLRNSDGSAKITIDGKMFSSGLNESIFKSIPRSSESENSFDYIVEISFHDESNTISPGRIATVEIE